MLSRPSEPEEQGAKGAKSVWVTFSRFESAEQFLGESTPRVTLELAAIPDAPARHRLPYVEVGRPWSAGLVHFILRSEPHVLDTVHCVGESPTVGQWNAAHFGSPPF